MGILNGNSICRSLCEKSLVHAITGNVERNKNRTDVHLYIDGPILLYCGNIKSNQVDLHKSINIIFGKLSKIISTVQNVYNVVAVKIFFDGEAPKEKAERQQQRLERKSDYNIQNIKYSFLRSIKSYWNNIPLLIQELTKGEAEMEMYKQRQDATVVYTKDTDMFTIAYGYEGAGEFIFCQERTSQTIHTYYFYDMKKFVIDGLSKETFAMLMGFVGTDYTESRLTRTQVENIFSGFEERQLESIQDCNLTAIENFLQTSSQYLLSCKGVRESRKYHKIKERAYLESIIWYINYIKYGVFS